MAGETSTSWTGATGSFVAWPPAPGSSRPSRATAPSRREAMVSRRPASGCSIQRDRPGRERQPFHLRRQQDDTPRGCGDPHHHHRCRGGSGGSAGDGGPATAAILSYPQGVAIDQPGNLCIGDAFAGRVRRVDAATGIIETFAGAGTLDAMPDGFPAAVCPSRSPTPRRWILPETSS